MLALLLILLALPLPVIAEGIPPEERARLVQENEVDFYNRILEPYNAKEWPRVLEIGEDWLRCVNDKDCPGEGARHDFLAFALSLSALEVHSVSVTAMEYNELRRLALDRMKPDNAAAGDPAIAKDHIARVHEALHELEPRRGHGRVSKTLDVAEGLVEDMQQAAADRNWQRMAQIGEQWLACLSREQCPDSGAGYDLLALRTSQAALQLKEAGRPYKAQEFRRVAVAPVLPLLQRVDGAEELAHLAQVLMAYQRLAPTNEDADVEQALQMHWRAVQALDREAGGQRPVSPRLAEMLHQHCLWALEGIASGAPDGAFGPQIRQAAAMGKGISTAQDMRFEDYEQIARFDNGNLRAGAPYLLGRTAARRGDFLRASEYLADAASTANTNAALAEIHRAWAHSLAADSTGKFSREALKHAELAYQAESTNPVNRELYARMLLDGVEVAPRRDGPMMEVIGYAQAGLAFPNELHPHFKLALAKVEAADNNERAVEMAAEVYERVKAAESPSTPYFRSAYRDILRQFGREGELPEDPNRPNIDVITTEAQGFQLALDDAFYRKDWGRALHLGMRYLECVESGRCPDTGEVHKEATFIVGLATSKLQSEEGRYFSPEQFLAYAINPLVEHINLAQRDLSERLPVLAKARMELFRMQEVKNITTADRALREMWQSIELERREEDHRTPVSEQVAAMLGVYVDFAKEAASYADDPEHYLGKARQGAELGLGAPGKYERHFRKVLANLGR